MALKYGCQIKKCYLKATKEIGSISLCDNHYEKAMGQEMTDAILH